MQSTKSVQHVVLGLVLCLVAVAAGVNAHFELVSPTSGRGFIDGDNPCPSCVPPCGSENSPNNRINFPVSNGKIFFKMLDGNGTVTVFYATDSNNVNGTNIAIPASTVVFPGASGTPTLNVTVSLPSQASIGQQGTIQLIYVSDKTFFQCQDILVTSTAASMIAGTAVWAMIAASVAATLLRAL